METLTNKNIGNVLFCAACAAVIVQMSSYWICPHAHCEHHHHLPEKQQSSSPLPSNPSVLGTASGASGSATPTLENFDDYV